MYPTLKKAETRLVEEEWNEKYGGVYFQSVWYT